MACRIIRQIVQLISITDGSSHTQVIVREYIRAAQRKDQEHLGRPASDPPDLGKRLHHTLVRQPTDPPQVQGAVNDLICQVGLHHPQHHLQRLVIGQPMICSRDAQDALGQAAIARKLLAGELADREHQIPQVLTQRRVKIGHELCRAAMGA